MHHVVSTRATQGGNWYTAAEKQSYLQVNKNEHQQEQPSA